MKSNLLFLKTVITFITYNSYAQNANVNLVPDKSKAFVYVDVMKTYERVAGKGYKSIDLFQKLGNFYFDHLEMDKAAKWYCELFAMTSDLDPKYYEQYAHSLKSIGQNEKADQLLQKCNLQAEIVVEQMFLKQR